MKPTEQSGTQQVGGARDAEHDRRWFTEWAPSIGAVGDARVAAGTLRQLMLAALHWIGEYKDARAECQRLAAELAAVRAERDHHKRQEARAWADADLARRERDEWFAAKVNADAELAAARAGREAVKPSTQGDTHAD